MVLFYSSPSTNCLDNVNLENSINLWPKRGEYEKEIQRDLEDAVARNIWYYSSEEEIVLGEYGSYTHIKRRTYSCVFCWWCLIYSLRFPAAAPLTSSIITHPGDVILSPFYRRQGRCARISRWSRGPRERDLSGRPVVEEKPHGGKPW